jgi:hypothetical protein
MRKGPVKTRGLRDVLHSEIRTLINNLVERAHSATRVSHQGRRERIVGMSRPDGGALLSRLLRAAYRRDDTGTPSPSRLSANSIPISVTRTSFVQSSSC